MRAEGRKGEPRKRGRGGGWNSVRGMEEKGKEIDRGGGGKGGEVEAVREI